VFFGKEKALILRDSSREGKFKVMVVCVYIIGSKKIICVGRNELFFCNISFFKYEIMVPKHI